MIYSFHLCRNFAFYHKYSLFRFYALCQKAHFLSYFNRFLHVCDLQFFYFSIILIELFLFCLLALAFYFFKFSITYSVPFLGVNYWHFFHYFTCHLFFFLLLLIQTFAVVTFVFLKAFHFEFLIGSKVLYLFLIVTACVCLQIK